MDITDIRALKSKVESEIEELLEELQKNTNTKINCVNIRISNIENFEEEKTFIEDVNIKLTI